MLKVGSWACLQPFSPPTLTTTSLGFLQDLCTVHTEPATQRPLLPSCCSVGCYRGLKTQSLELSKLDFKFQAE